MNAPGASSGLGPVRSDPHPAAALYPTELQQRVDAYLAELPLGGTAGADDLVEAMRYSLLAGGKRVRPVLALATAEALGHEPESVLPFAAAIEMIHTYSLIHDDLPAMDDDELRRGKPTCHVAYGEDVAILAGDGLFAEALRLAAAEQEADPAALLAAVAELTAAVGVDGMVGGQFLDVTAPGDLGPAELRRVHELQDRPPDRGVGELRCCTCAGRRRLRDSATAVSRPSWACCSRSWTTSST